MSAELEAVDTQAGSTRREGRESPWVVVLSREVMVKLTDKTFILSTAFTLVLLVGVLGVQAFLAGRSHDVTLGVAGQQATSVAHQVDRLTAQRDEAMTVEVRRSGSVAAVEQAVRDGDVDAGLVHDGSGWRLIGKSGKDDKLAGAVNDVVQQDVLQRAADRAGTTVAALKAGSDVRYDLLSVDANRAGFAKAVGFALAMLFYMAAIGFGMMIAGSVVEEKQSRVVEILVTAIPVRQLLFGKVVGNTLLAMAQMALFVGVGLVGLTFTDYAKFLTAISTPVVWFVMFFVAGFVALACIWAVAGSLATRHEDLQATTTPLTMCLVIAFIAGLSLEGVGQVVASYVPVVSTIVMPMRLLQGTAAWWEPVLALLVTAAFAVVTVTLGERLYRRSLLQTQGRMTYRQALRAAD
ncbi:MAG TPA: ABC transporter permease [Segeticoccus sp.]|uniref:ABC transporter permease n=1 Tax=Segeticoccus sp. TaxID=2706531 RepID=UPI002D806597|nr:ABC transporter permease [Segeticoccus sp.]HET8601983.1 ABC transporter permease [Segeticoccus sp.]